MPAYVTHILTTDKNGFPLPVMQVIHRVSRTNHPHY